MLPPRLLAIWMGGLSIIGILLWAMSDQWVKHDAATPGSSLVAPGALSATGEPAPSVVEPPTQLAVTALPESVAIQKTPEGTTVINIGVDMDADDRYAFAEETEPVNIGVDMDADNPVFVSDDEEPVNLGEPLDADAVLDDFSQSEEVQNIGPDLEVDYADLDEASELEAPVNIGPDIEVPEDY